MRLLVVFCWIRSEPETLIHPEPTLCTIAPTAGDSSSFLLLRRRIMYIVVEVTFLVGRTSNCLDDGLLVGLLPMRPLMTKDVKPCGAHRDGTAAMQIYSNREDARANCWRFLESRPAPRRKDLIEPQLHSSVVILSLYLKVIIMMARMERRENIPAQKNQ